MCSLFGVLDYGGMLSARTRHALTRSLAVSAEERGTDATGIAYMGASRPIARKAPVRARKFKFYIPQPARFIMGHTRMTTQGDEARNWNNHPFIGKAKNMSFALAHNGIIWNDKQLQSRFKLPKTRIETDSYVIVQLLERMDALSFNSMRKVAEALEGSFTVTVLSELGLDVIRGNNPFCLWHFPNRRVYVYASTEDILRRGLWRTCLSDEKHEQIEIRMGDILRFAPDGEITRSGFDARNLFVDIGWHSNFVTSEYAELVRDSARWMGVPDAEVDLLFDVGYDAAEVEALMYDTPLRRRLVKELISEYGYQ